MSPAAINRIDGVDDTTTAHIDRANQDDTLRAWLNNGCHPAELTQRWTTLNHTAVTNHQHHTTLDPAHLDPAHLDPAHGDPLEGIT